MSSLSLVHMEPFSQRGFPAARSVQSARRLPDVVERIRSLVTAGHVRLGVLRLAVEKEHDLRVRRKFALIERDFEHAAA